MDLLKRRILYKVYENIRYFLDHYPIDTNDINFSNTIFGFHQFYYLL